MITFECENSIFHYNSDMSGKVIIISVGNEIEINGKDILDFVANYVRDRKISMLESEDTNKILGIN